MFFVQARSFCTTVAIPIQVDVFVVKLLNSTLHGMPNVSHHTAQLMSRLISKVKPRNTNNKFDSLFESQVVQMCIGISASKSIGNPRLKYRYQRTCLVNE